MIHVCFMVIRILRSKNIQGEIFIVVDLKYIATKKSKTYESELGHHHLCSKCSLEQTKGLGINVYTHGEMLPAHGYPGLHKYPHLAGHYGGAWYKQKSDFSHFPGSILVTTNCVLDPLESYRSNIFTTNEVCVCQRRSSISWLVYAHKYMIMFHMILDVRHPSHAFIRPLC